MKRVDYVRRPQQPLLARRSSSFFGRKQTKPRPSFLVNGNFFHDEQSEMPFPPMVPKEEPKFAPSETELSQDGIYPLSAHAAVSHGSGLSMLSTSSDHLRDIEPSQQQICSLTEERDIYNEFKQNSTDSTLSGAIHDGTAKEALSPVSVCNEHCNDIENRVPFKETKAKVRKSMMNPTVVGDSEEANDKQGRTLDIEISQMGVDDRSASSAPSTESIENKELEAELPTITNTGRTSSQYGHLPERKRTFRERLMRKVSPRRSQYSQHVDASDTVQPHMQKHFSERRSSLGRLWSVLSGGRQNEEVNEKRGSGDVKKGEKIIENEGPLSDDMSQPFHFLRSTESVDTRFPKKLSPASAYTTELPLRAKSQEQAVSKLTRQSNESETDGDNDESGTSRNDTGRHSSVSSHGSSSDGKKARNQGMFHRFSSRLTKARIGDSERHPGRPSRLQGALQNIMAGTGVSSRGMGCGVWKAGVYEFNCDAQTSFHEVRKLLEGDYFGVVITERFQELRMRVPLTVSSKLTLINIVVTSETRGETSRVAIRRAFGDALCVRNDDFDWFCFDVYRRVLKIRDVIRPYYS